MKKTALIITLFIYSIAFCKAQELSRRAKWQAKFSTDFALAPGAVITSLDEGTPLQKEGLKVGDRIIEVNEQLITSGEIWTDVTYSIRTDYTKLRVKRGVEVFEMDVKLNAIPYEEHPGIDTEYTSLVSDYGIRQRVIITKPQNNPGKLPAIILIQGLSCSTIESYPGRSGNWPRVIRDMIRKSGMVMVRIEKPGVGDSEGNCAETDFHTELNGYEKLVEYAKSLPYVDTRRMIVYGSSMGSAIAPFLANKYDLAGVISDGVFFKTWFEHMLEIERRIRQMSGDTEDQITEKMNKYYIPLYYGMLMEKKSYAEVIDEYPALAAYNYHSPRHMYGRPVEYYHQVQDFNFAGQWEKLDFPVRINRGTNDWIMSDADNDMIVEVLQRNGHNDFELYRFQGLDHWNTIHENAANSFHGKKGKWKHQISGVLIEWARELAGID